MPMISGVIINLGGTDYTVPPLNFSALKRLQPTIESLSSISAAMTSDQIDGVANIVLAAIQRNYPDISSDQILDFLDMGNAGAILKAVLGQSGIQQAGEAPAVSVNP